MSIEFISYTGCYPNLCSGTLVVKIDGIEHTFDGYYKDSEYVHPKFWISGGGLSNGYSGTVQSHLELINDTEIFDLKIREILPKLLELFIQLPNH